MLNIGKLISGLETRCGPEWESAAGGRVLPGYGSERIARQSATGIAAGPFRVPT